MSYSFPFVFGAERTSKITNRIMSQPPTLQCVQGFLLLSGNKMFNMACMAPPSVPAPSVTKRPHPLLSLCSHCFQASVLTTWKVFPLAPHLENLYSDCESQEKPHFLREAFLKHRHLFPVWSSPHNSFFSLFVTSYWFVSLLYSCPSPLPDCKLQEVHQDPPLFHSLHIAPACSSASVGGAHKSWLNQWMN